MSVEITHYSRRTPCANCNGMVHVVVETHQYYEFGSHDLCPACAREYADQILRAALEAAIDEKEGDWA